ncbi:MAG: Xaa-Pro peptidase family protein [Marinobacter sp.]|uniref:M24 family metallopeptidase n=1 Tax=Marinobacter sp. TaxID=50741 RepID=UPI00299EDE13|nr:Xaa-Pro peptidase family protein [Marinobacter sp.]MDX1633554.1 Xaa-Pro peptidase family protein [Marinobacter sp.]
MDHITYQDRLRNVLSNREAGFPDAEFDRRGQALDRRLEASGLDALLITQPADIYYLTGYNTFEVSVHTALVYSPGRRVLQVPSIETGPAVACARCEEILGYRWEGPEEVIAPLADALAAAGSRIGIDAWGAGLRHGIVEGLKRKLGRVELLDASGLLAPVKRVKSDLEIACLERSARITEAGIAAARAAVQPGVTDNDVAAAASAAMLAAGTEFMSMQPIVVAGRRSSIIHTNHRRFPIAAGEPVFIELGAAYERYTAPLMHTLVAGSESPPERMRRVADIGHYVFNAVTGAMTPGNSFDQAARAGEAALAPLVDDVFFSGVFGYTVGAQFPPSWVEGSGFIARGQQALFEPNMVFHLPLCLRIPGHWGIGFSETVRVTETGAEALTRNSWVLQPSH